MPRLFNSAASHPHPNRPDPRPGNHQHRCGPAPPRATPHRSDETAAAGRPGALITKHRSRIPELLSPDSASHAAGQHAPRMRCLPAAGCRNDHPGPESYTFLPTTSVPSPMPRQNRSVDSPSGVRISPNPDRWNCSRAMAQRPASAEALPVADPPCPEALELTHVRIQVQRLHCGWPQAMMLRLATKSIKASCRVRHSIHRSVPPSRGPPHQTQHALGR